MMVAIRPGQLGERDPADLLGLVILGQANPVGAARQVQLVRAVRRTGHRLERQDGLDRAEPVSGLLHWSKTVPSGISSDAGLSRIRGFSSTTRSPRSFHRVRSASLVTDATGAGLSVGRGGRTFTE